MQSLEDGDNLLLLDDLPTSSPPPKPRQLSPKRFSFDPFALSPTTAALSEAPHPLPAEEVLNPFFNAWAEPASPRLPNPQHQLSPENPFGDAFLSSSSSAQGVSAQATLGKVQPLSAPNLTLFTPMDQADLFAKALACVPASVQQQMDRHLLAHPALNWDPETRRFRNVPDFALLQQVLGAISVSSPPLQPKHGQAPTVVYEEVLHATNNFAEKLGGGGEGEVYSGVLRGVNVAIKILDINAGMRKTLQNEVDLLSRFGHINVIALHGVSIDGPNMCLIYPRLYCSLFQRLFNPVLAIQPLSWRQRMSWATDIVRGIGYLDVVAHCIHGDLKSENVLLDQRTGQAVLTDFGLLRPLALRPDGSAQSVTITMSIKGTYAYLAPEVISGELSPAQDVFAMGVILLELMTSKLPLDHNRKPKALLDFMVPALRQPDTLPLAVDPNAGWPAPLVKDLGSLVIRSTCQFRQERPTATEMLHDLDRLFAQHARPPHFIPEAFRCLLTGAVFIDPVVADDGNTYERSAIAQWLQGSLASPRTGQRLATDRLVDNLHLKGALDWVKSSGPSEKEPWSPI
eukprot:GGOE01018604.1.p1 GENE.GGOE01018604.1~~GGOE01018604.1.p1  ORF type:complete len:571 (+),score=138.88 GGOE01018604.1:60-1772(+)